MNIFTYGALVIPEVMRRVTGRVFRCEEASLHGYAPFLVKGELDAGLTPFPDRAAEGVVYYDVDRASLSLLDAFEGDRFERVEVNVETESGDWVEAQTYLLRYAQRKHLTAQPWDEDVFRTEHLKDFLRSRADTPERPA